STQFSQLYSKEATMITSIALVLFGAAATAATPCENLASLKLENTTITSAVVVPEGPAPARGAGGGARGGARGGGVRGGGAPQAEGAVPQSGQQAAGARAAAPPANIPAHCRVQIVLKPTSDSLINMELWLPTQNWNG